MLRVICALSVFSLTLFGCQAVKGNSSRLDIRDGVSTNDFPAVGFLNINDTNACTGTLLSPTVVLAAAHCVTEDNFSPFRPNTNISFEIGGKTIMVERFEHHPSYMDYLDNCAKAVGAGGRKLFTGLLLCQDEESFKDCENVCSTCTEKPECVSCVQKACIKQGTACGADKDCRSLKSCKAERKIDEYPNDLALLFLAKPVTKIKPMAVGHAPMSGETITMVGFGPTSPDRLDELGIKSRGDTRVGEVQERSYNFHGSGMNRANLLGGDSGGPSLVKRDGKIYIVGVHSHISSFCDTDEEIVGVDIRVNAYLDWMKKRVPDLLLE